MTTFGVNYDPDVRESLEGLGVKLLPEGANCWTSSHGHDHVHGEHADNIDDIQKESDGDQDQEATMQHMTMSLSRLV